MWYETNEDLVHIFKHRFLTRKFYIPVKCDRAKSYVNVTTRR